MSKAKLGSGQRFAALKDQLSNEQGVNDPAALAASIGRKKLGKAKFQSLASKGKKSSKKKPSDRKFRDTLSSKQPGNRKLYDALMS